jgi:ABC-type bacteriocin/lantibiotic exporter with double-glycine peptidase domain
MQVVQRLGVLPLLLAAGCSYLGRAVDFDPRVLDEEPGWVRARGVEPILQEEEADCGAAALATALNAWGLEVSLADVASLLPSPEKGGSRAGELRDGARSLGMLAHLVQGELGDLERELAGARPVVVGMLKPHVGGPRSHYEVVAAFHRERGLVVTADPARGWRRNDVAGFLEEWTPTGRLSLLLLGVAPPGPARPLAATAD